jgi:hypothetical protein
MGVEYLKLIYDGVSSTISEVPTWSWWAVGIGFLLLVLWTIKR